MGRHDGGNGPGECWTPTPRHWDIPAFGAISCRRVIEYSLGRHPVPTYSDFLLPRLRLMTSHTNPEDLGFKDDHEFDPTSPELLDDLDDLDG